MELTEAEERVFTRLREIEHVIHGYDIRWRFRNSLEPVTKEIRSMERKGLIEVIGTACGPQILVNQIEEQS